MYKIIIKETSENKAGFADKLIEIANLIKNGHSYDQKYLIVEEDEFEYVETSDSLESKIKILIENNPSRFPYEPLEDPFYVLGYEEVRFINSYGVNTTEGVYDFEDLYQVDLEYIYGRLVKYLQE